MGEKAFVYNEKMHTYKGFLIAGGAVVVAFLIAYLNPFDVKLKSVEPRITNFAECIAAGNPAMESYPRQCAHEGQTFVEEISGTFPTIASPFPFQELTIPYLRQRQYRSILSELKQAYEGADYTAFLTSYDSDGLHINALLTQPKGDIPQAGWPAIVFVHGYIPPQNYRTRENYNAYVDYLAKSGFVVFKIDLRGHGESEGEPSGAYYSGDYIIDTLNARAALQSTHYVDPDRIGLWGHSMAGNIVFRSFVAAQNIPAAVIWAGAVYTYTDFSQYRISDGSYQSPPADSERVRKRQELFDMYGAFTETSSFWQQVVPTNYLEGVTGALEINHAVDDAVVSLEYSRNLMQVLDGTSITHELHEYPTGGHNISGTSFTSAMQNTVQFFKQNL